MMFHWLKLAPVVALLLCGCGQSKAPQPLAVEQVPATVENAFKEASPETKSAANEIVASVQGKDEPKALLDLQVLFGRPDLTPEQREAASRAMLSVHERLRTAAAQGDPRAAAALEAYRSAK